MARERTPKRGWSRQWNLDLSQLDKCVRIGKGLPRVLCDEIVLVLCKYAFAFSWGPEDMSGIDRSIITHKLAIDLAHKPVKQKQRHLSSE